jgi:hypothetical protein
MKSNVAGRLRMMSVLAALRAGLPSFGTGNTARARPGRVAHRGGTFNAERNAEKRAARADARAQRADQVRIYRESEVGPRRAPKSKLSALMIDMLAERRLRQTGRAA